MLAPTRQQYRCVQFLSLFLSLGPALAARADVDPNSGIDFVRVGNAGNAGVPFADLPPFFQGRGSVDYEYQIGRTEVTTSQWLEFYNGVLSRYPTLFSAPFWPGVTTSGDPNAPYRLRNPEAAMYPVAGVTWRGSAIFCNWLHNNKQFDWASISNGAYDISTFGYNGNVFTDQAAHNPGARYWIPTLDEWIKGAYYDPNRNGTNQGGWWRSPNMSDTPLIYGPPGVGQANAGFDSPNPYAIQLMSYPDTHSAYGMLDAAGGTREWLETILITGGLPTRMVMGTGWTSAGLGGGDSIDGFGALFPNTIGSIYGFRIASAVPAPHATSVFGIFLVGTATRRRRRITCDTSPSCSFLRSTSS